MNTRNMPGFTAERSLYGASAGDRYIMRLTKNAGITDQVLPQAKFDQCMRGWKGLYIGCRLDGNSIDDCSFLGEVWWEAMDC
jgi:hypothetical protein